MYCQNTMKKVVVLVEYKQGDKKKQVVKEEMRGKYWWQLSLSDNMGEPSYNCSTYTLNQGPGTE